MKAKFLTEGLFLLILTCIFQYYLMQATQAATTVDETRNSYDEDDDDREDIAKSFNSQAVTYYNHTQITIYLAWISLTFPIRIFLTMAFAKKSKRRYQLLTTTNILDIVIFTVFTIRLHLEYKYFTNGLGDNTSRGGADESDGVIYYDNVFRDSSYSDDVDYLYSIGSA
jgi:nicotinamide riboside transporter PnuC